MKNRELSKFQELIDKYISEEALAKVHNEGLKAGKRIFKNNNSTGEIEEVGFEPDYAVRHKYLETGYKVRGRMKEHEKPGDIYNQFNFFDGKQLKRIARRVQDGDTKGKTASD